MKFKRNVFTLIFIVLFVVICCKSQMKKLVKGETLTPELSIVSYNISYSDSVYLMAAVSYNNIDYTANPIKLLFWDAEQTEYTVNNASYQSSAVASKIVKNQECLIYYSKGIAAREMADVIYMRAYVEIDGVEYYSDLITYSVVQYVKDRITNSNCTEAQLNMYKAMLDYGTAAQILLNNNTENLANADFAMISVKNGTLPNGTNMYMYLNNQTIKVTANDIENKEFLYWQDGEGNIVSYEKEYEFVINGNAFLEAVYAEIIDIYVDTINLNVTQNNDLSWCNITCENSNDLVYIIITVTINDDIYKNSFYKLIVNGKEVSASKLQISEDEIVYKMDDPNWSDFV